MLNKFLQQMAFYFIISSNTLLLCFVCWTSNFCWLCTQKYFILLHHKICVDVELKILWNRSLQRQIKQNVCTRGNNRISSSRGRNTTKLEVNIEFTNLSFWSFDISIFCLLFSCSQWFISELTSNPINVILILAIIFLIYKIFKSDGKFIKILLLFYSFWKWILFGGKNWFFEMFLSPSFKYLTT